LFQRGGTKTKGFGGITVKPLVKIDGGAKVDLLDCRFELIFSPKLPFTSYLFLFLAKAERN